MRKEITKLLKQSYKPDRFYGRGANYANVVIGSKIEALKQFGHTLISHYDSVSGRAVYFYLCKECGKIQEGIFNKTFTKAGTNFKCNKCKKNKVSK